MNSLVYLKSGYSHSPGVAKTLESSSGILIPGIFKKGYAGEGPYLCIFWTKGGMVNPDIPKVALSLLVNFPGLYFLICISVSFPS